MLHLETVEPHTFSVLKQLTKITELQHFSVAGFIQFYKEKYTTQNLLITVPHAITFFLDADESEDPVS